MYKSFIILCLIMAPMFSMSQEEKRALFIYMNADQNLEDSLQKDLKEIPDNVYEGVNIHPVNWIDEVFAIALTKLPTPKTKTTVSRKKPGQDKSQEIQQH